MLFAFPSAAESAVLYSVRMRTRGGGGGGGDFNDGLLWLSSRTRKYEAK